MNKEKVTLNARDVSLNSLSLFYSQQTKNCFIIYIQND